MTWLARALCTVRTICSVKYSLVTWTCFYGKRQDSQALFTVDVLLIAMIITMLPLQFYNKWVRSAVSLPFYRPRNRYSNSKPGFPALHLDSLFMTMVTTPLFPFCHSNNSSLFLPLDPCTSWFLSLENSTLRFYMSDNFSLLRFQLKASQTSERSSSTTPFNTGSPFQP